MSTGRRISDVPVSQIEDLLHSKFSVPKIAQMLGFSVSTIRRRMKTAGITIKEYYSQISDEDLQQKICEILVEMPNLGMKLIKGMLWSRFHIRVPEQRLREAVRSADPVGVGNRRRANRTINRRTYYVENFKSLWHLDTNMKLIRYKLIVKSCIDGKSRLCPYISISGNNSAVSNLHSFMDGVRRYGLPQRTRSDRGGEGVLIARLMIEARGTGRGSHLTGRSVNNQRIERFWGDLYRVTGAFYETFSELEQEGKLNVDDDNELWLLHFVYLPRLNKVVEDFRRGWNSHPLSTENNMTPEQLAIFYSSPDEDFNQTLANAETIYSSILMATVEPLDEQPLDPIRNPSNLITSFSNECLQELAGIDIMRESLNNGKDVYLECFECFQNHH